MKIGSILGALSPGLSATGLFGHGAQGVGQDMLMAGSPLLAMLLAKKKQQPNAAASAAPAVAPTASPLAAPQPLASAPATLPQAMANLPQMQTGMDPAKRQRIASMLLQFGGQQSNPFGPRY